MSKQRVYEVARELGLPNRELVERISALGIEVRNHMTALEPSDVERVKRALRDKEAPSQVVEERIRPTVVRRRAVTKAAEAPEPVAAPVATAPATGGAGRGTPDGGPQARSVPRDDASADVRRESAASDPRSSGMTDRQAVDIGRSAAAAVNAAATNGVAAGAPRSLENAGSGPKSSTSPEPVASVEAGESAARRAEAPGGAAPEGASARAAAAAESGESSSTRSAGTAAAAEPSASTPAKAEPQVPDYGSSPPPASVRFAHGNLPPGVVSRGKTTVQGTAAISDSARQRIVSEHAARRADLPRRRELGRAALGPAGRPQVGRPGKRRALPGRKGKQTELTTPSAQKRLIRIEDQVQLQTLAQRIGVKATEVLMKLMQLGMTGVHINSTLDADTAQVLASEFGYEVENVAVSDEDLVTQARGDFDDLEADRVVRAPVVTVMGHVDHGKTSLLDHIRKANVASGEAGGITQHIGAYRVQTKSGPVVFLDTPGHEAFTSLRARGAQVTDTVILVVAADDGIMPQTREAIAHSKAAGVPIIVAINKCDKPGANPEQIKRELSGEGLQPEEWGGDTQCFEVSALTGQNVDALLAGVALQSEMLELRANPGVPGEGVVLEAYLDRGRGPVANVLVRNGTLRTGDIVVAGAAYGRIRAMTNDLGKTIKEAAPATPIEVLGLSDLPGAGDSLYVVTDQKRAQEIAEEKRRYIQQASAVPTIGLDAVYQMMQAGQIQELKVVLKADVHGSLEALQKSLADAGTDKVKVQVIHSGVGGITENDIMLASASKALVIGFNVRPAGQAASTAKQEGVETRLYTIIYEAIDDVKQAMAGLLAPNIIKTDIGRAQVREVFVIPKIGAIAGCYLDQGKITRHSKARLVRDAIVVWEGAIGSLRRFKEDIKEVTLGFECGIRLEGYSDVKPGDVIEAYEETEVAATL